MRLSYQQAQVDRQKMKNFVCERILLDGTRVVLAEGEAGETWADLHPAWDEEAGWDLFIETNDPEAVGLCEVYDHFRVKRMTWREWRRELMGEVKCSKVRCTAEGESAQGVIESKLEQLLDLTRALFRQEQVQPPQSPASTVGAILTKKEVARRFQISTRTLDRWRSMGIDLGEININGCPRFDPEKITRIIATQKVRRRRRAT